MTLVKREVTKSKEQKKTVTTCDVCNIEEQDMPEGESVVELKSNKKTDKTYVLHIHQIENKDYSQLDEGRHEFDTMEEANDSLEDIDMDNDVYDKVTEYKTTWDFEMDICEHCMTTLFSAAKEVGQKS